MTPAKTDTPRVACSGEFHATCVVCGHLTHAGHLDRRACDQGHRAYIGKSRCTLCFHRDQKAGRLPLFSLVKHHNRKPGRVVTVLKVTVTAHRHELPDGWTPVPPEQRGTTPAPCDRCGHIVRLPFGPGDALCEPCRDAELVDMVGAYLDYGGLVELAGAT